MIRIQVFVIFGMHSLCLFQGIRSFYPTNRESIVPPAPVNLIDMCSANEITKTGIFIQKEFKKIASKIYVLSLERFSLKNFTSFYWNNWLKAFPIYKYYKVQVLFLFFSDHTDFKKRKSFNPIKAGLCESSFFRGLDAKLILPSYFK